MNLRMRTRSWGCLRESFQIDEAGLRAGVRGAHWSGTLSEVDTVLNENAEEISSS